MSNRLFRFSIAAAAAFVGFAVSPASASPITFAQYFQTNGNTQQWTVSTTGGTTTVHASGSVLFLFSGVPGLPFSGAETATFTLNATSSSNGFCAVACAAGDSFTQQGFTGSFSFIDQQSAPGTNLLSGIFSTNATPATSGATLGASIGGGGANFLATADSSNLNQLVMSSAYLNFFNQTQETASWTLSSLIPNFAVTIISGNTAQTGAGPFSGSGTGTFSSNPGPTGTPEPQSVLLIGGGLIGLGVLIRRRRPGMGAATH